MAHEVNVKFRLDSYEKKRFPFEVSVDPFYSKENVGYLEKKALAYRSGCLKFAEHKLIED